MFINMLKEAEKEKTGNWYGFSAKLIVGDLKRSI